MNKKNLLIMFLFCLFPFWMQADEIACILPKPAHISVQDEKGFLINTKTVIYTTPQASATAELWAATLRQGTGLELPVKVTSRAANKQGICFVLPEKTTDTESYSLNITPKRVLIQSQGEAGLFYGAQTLNQLLPAEMLEGKGNIQEMSLPSLAIQDSPRFKWRGYMQDVSRTFYSIDVLKKYIDVMSLYKLNTLHLHLTDDQGWRIEIKKYPRLTSEKATRFPDEYKQPEKRSGFYTQEELKDLVAYAAARHIRIVPEIDVPGHCWPVLINYPELAVSSNLYPDYVMPFCATYHVWGHQFTPNTLDPTNEKVYQFLDDVFTELVEIFPSEYIHFGGDEVVHSVWQNEPRIKQFMADKGMKRVEELQSYFVSRVSKIIRSKGKQPIGWNDILSDAKNLPKGTNIMSWIGSSAVKDAAQYGFPTIATPSSHLYFDIRQGSRDDGLLADLAYAHVISLQNVYEYDPANGLTDQEQKCLLGVQANMWPAVPQEVKDINVQNFPRLLALAEIAWADGKKDFQDFETRLAPQYKRLNALKIDYYRPGGHIIATWEPKDVKTNDYVVWEWDVTPKVYANGRAMAGLFYTQGKNKLNIKKMQLLENGKVIAEDTHRGFADETRATSKPKNYLYFLDVKDYKPQARYTLRAEVSGYAGTESYGNVIFSLAPYQDFSAVEADK